MAVVAVGHHPELTAEKAMEIFRKHFTGKYEVYMTRVVGVDFIVKKSACVGVSVRLKQEASKTSFVFNYFTPSALLRVLFAGFGGLIGVLILRLSLKKVENEVRSFIEGAAEFK